MLNSLKKKLKKFIVDEFIENPISNPKKTTKKNEFLIPRISILTEKTAPFLVGTLLKNTRVKTRQNFWLLFEFVHISTEGGTMLPQKKLLSNSHSLIKF